MKILIVTPLYPPDIAGHAPYVKELATRLKDTHTVTILAYNHIPEKIPGVEIIVVEKHLPLLKRLSVFTKLLYTHARRADIVYVQNGPSTELPMILVSLFVRKPFIIRLGDRAALTYAKQSFTLHIIQKIAEKHACKIVSHVNPGESTFLEEPRSRPEILPLSPYPTEAFHIYENSWNAHITELTTLFSSCHR